MAEFITSPALSARHGFFTRRGGVSTGPFASLNCSRSSPDRAEDVAENRARVTRAVGAAVLVGLQQVHGDTVVTVTEPWNAGEGPRADAMVTRVRSVALGIVTADCAPVLLCDAAGEVAGAIHAGWRGAVAGVLEATVRAMQTLGAKTISAAIGPCIRQDSYEVGPDLRDAVLQRDPAHGRFFADAGPGGRPGHWQFDLPGYCAERLSGLARVDVVAIDTLADADRFFSHRRRTLAGGGPIGHQISAVVL